MPKLRPNSSQSFTLIELLVVIGVLAVLALAVLISLNPQELIKQARDSKRISDLASINKALSWLLADCPNCFFGTSSIVYVSIPDTSSNCSNLNLPPLPPGYQYRCVTQENLRKIDGNGWIPVNFKQFSAGSSLSSLPVDPINNAQTGEYYTYVTGGSWELTALFSSNKYLDKSTNDGDAFPGVYSLRTSYIPLTPGVRDKGLVGYWKFDEGSGTTAYDSSGNNNNGTLVNNPLWQSNCRVGNCLYFNGVNQYVVVTSSDLLNLTNVGTVLVWINIPSSWSGTLYPNVVSKGANAGWDSPGWSLFSFNPNSDGRIGIGFRNGSNTLIVSFINSIKDQWIHIAGVWNGSMVFLYQNSFLKNSRDQAISPPSTSYPVTIGKDNSSQYFNGLIDEVRIYNRALSESEIKAIYEATK